MVNIILKSTDEKIIARTGKHLELMLGKPVEISRDYATNRAISFIKSLGLLDNAESLNHMISIIKNYRAKFDAMNTITKDHLISIESNVPDAVVSAIYPSSIVIKFCDVNKGIEKVKNGKHIYVIADVYYLDNIEELLDSLDCLIIGNTKFNDTDTYYTLQRKYMENLSGMPITKGIEQLFVENLKDKIGGSIISYNNTLGVLKDDILYTLYRIIKK